MKNLKFFLLFIVVALLFSACDNKNAVVLKGHLDNCQYKYVYFSEVRPDELDFIDSVKITNGNFEYVLKGSNYLIKARHANPFFLRITLDNRDFGFTTLAKNGETIEICGDAATFPKSYSVQGYDEAENICFLDKQLALFIDSVDYLNEIYKDYIEYDTVRAKVNEAYLGIVANHKAFLQDYINSHLGSFSTVTAFYRRYNSCFFFDEKDDLDLLKKIYSSLSDIYPDNENVAFLNERIVKAEF